MDMGRVGRAGATEKRFQKPCIGLHWIAWLLWRASLRRTRLSKTFRLVPKRSTARLTSVGAVWWLW
jgi:hypothetical protein